MFRIWEQPLISLLSKTQQHGYKPHSTSCHYFSSIPISFILQTGLPDRTLPDTYGASAWRRRVQGSPYLEKTEYEIRREDAKTEKAT